MDVDEEEETEQPLFRRRAVTKRPVTYAESESEGAAGADTDSEDEMPSFSKGRKRNAVKRARKSKDEDDFIVPDDHDEDEEEMPLDAGNASDDDDASAAEEDSDADDVGKPAKRSKTNAQPEKGPLFKLSTGLFFACSWPQLGSVFLQDGQRSSGLVIIQLIQPARCQQRRCSQWTVSSGSLAPHQSRTPCHEEKRKKAENEQAYSFLVDLRDKDGNRPGDAEYDSRTVYIPKSAWKDFTPFEEQFWRIKQNHWDTVLFFQKGKFYELYEEDALIGHREFDLKLTDRVKMKMVGVPEASFDIFAAKFLALGYKVEGWIDRDSGSQGQARWRAFARRWIRDCPTASLGMFSPVARSSMLLRCRMTSTATAFPSRSRPQPVATVPSLVCARSMLLLPSST